jgi:ABC-type bacteriocin/lantibiotic exporter with double-glycine peptidase domain
MEITIVIIIATFIVPLITVVLIWIWSSSLRKRFTRDRQEKDALIDLLEKLVNVKNSIIEKLRL